MNEKVIIDSNSKNSISLVRDNIYSEISPVFKSGRNISIICIGSDRSTGDSLGPLVGEKLKFLTREHFSIYGNLQYPVHAKNLLETLETVNKINNDPFIIAVDACLGSLEHVGNIILQKSPLIPGAAVNKDLPPVGNLSITGVVNISGSMEFMVLQNTRLYNVMQLANLISEGIYHSILKTFGGRKYSFHGLDFSNRYRNQNKAQ
ncbi:MAG: hypothetical protein K0R54_3902 [Clostridiaceae bacterium]|nr:hypothetical protein [Clostridiaceae bacterium]